MNSKINSEMFFGFWRLIRIWPNGTTIVISFDILGVVNVNSSKNIYSMDPKYNQYDIYIKRML